MTLRERYLDKAKNQSRTITPKFLAEPVEIVALTLAARRDLLKSCTVDGDPDADGKRSRETDMALLQVRVIIETARDPETHEPIFTAADQDMLLGLPATSFDELASVALDLNGLMVVFANALTEREKAEKN